MKKLLLLIVIIVTTAYSSRAQNYHKLLDNSYWVVDQGNFGIDWALYYTQQGNTMMNGQTYALIDIITINTYTSPTLSLELIREDTLTKHVYLQDSNHPSGERLLYDFSVSIGDTVLYEYSPMVDSFIVTNVTLVSTPVGMRKQFSLTPINLHPYASFSYIEGVGGIRDLIHPYSPVADPSSYLTCAEQNSILTYGTGPCEQPIVTNITETQTEKTKVSPNPFSDFTTIDIGTPQRQLTTLTLFDMSGRMIKTTSANSSKFQLQRDGLPSGYYLLQCTLDDGSMVNKKLMIAE